MLENNLQRAAIKRDYAVEITFGDPVEVRLPVGILGLEQFGAHHRSQRERHHRRNQDGDRQRDGKLPEQPSDNVAHEQEGNQHRDQRHGQRNDREANLPRTLQGRLQRRFTLFEIAVDVLDHHDRIVHHEPGRDGEGHQREVVQAVAEQVHHAKRADQR